MIHVDDRSAVYPVIIDPLISQVKQLTVDDGAADDWYGGSVGISGDTVIVGAYANDGAGTDSGSAYVFERSAGGTDNWGLVKKLTAADADVSDCFGHSVGISGDTVIVGAHLNDDAGTDSGSAYVFERNAGGADNWGQVRKLTAADADVSDWFGVSVGISGDTVIVGAIRNDDAGSDSGSAYVFERNAGGADNWGEVTKLTAADADAGDRFGVSVGISGDTVIVGAHLNDDAGSASGSAYVFERNAGGADNWGEVTKLTADIGAFGDYFGHSVGISGDTVIVGAHNNDDAGAFVFERDFGGVDSWGQVKALTAADGATGDSFGRKVGISGDTVVVGAPLNDHDAVQNSGAAYVFERDFGGAGNWGEVTKLTADNLVDFACLGWSVGIDGDTAIVGGSSHNAGSAYVFFPAVDLAVDLAVSMTESVDPVVAGSGTGNLTYTVTVTNHGPSDATGVELSEDLTLPAGVSVELVTPSAGSFANTTAPDGTWTVGDLANGASATLTIALTVDVTAAIGTDVIHSTAAVSTVNQTDTDSANDLSTESTSIAHQSDLGITKDDGVTSAVPGESVTYTIVASNAGPSKAVKATVADTFPAGLSDCTWTCATTGTGACNNDGSGDINELVDLAVGDTVTFTAICTIDVTAGGTLSNTATVAAGAGATDPEPGDNSATDDDTALRWRFPSIRRPPSATRRTPTSWVPRSTASSASGRDRAATATAAIPWARPISPPAARRSSTATATSGSTRPMRSSPAARWAVTPTPRA
ncbi:MAG: DUF11 domain-containing protein [bacterium]|nr:DUF11 domain-containing protein [bacterium]